MRLQVRPASFVRKICLPSAPIPFSADVKHTDHIVCVPTGRQMNPPSVDASTLPIWGCGARPDVGATPIAQTRSGLKGSISEIGGFVDGIAVQCAPSLVRYTVLSAASAQARVAS